MIKVTYKCKVLPLKLDCVLKQFNIDQSQKGFTATVLFDTLQIQYDTDMTRVNENTDRIQAVAHA